jgi:hypothetical protein
MPMLTLSPLMGSDAGAPKSPILGVSMDGGDGGGDGASGGRATPPTPPPRTHSASFRKPYLTPISVTRTPIVITRKIAGATDSPESVARAADVAASSGPPPPVIAGAAAPEATVVGTVLQPAAHSHSHSRSLSSDASGVVDVGVVAGAGAGSGAGSSGTALVSDSGPSLPPDIRVSSSVAHASGAAAGAGSVSVSWHPDCARV